MTYLRKIAPLFIAGVLLLAFAGVAAAQSPPLVSWWPAEGDAKDIIGGNNGNLVGSVTFSPGKVGQAFSFSGFGTDYVQVPDDTTLEPTQVTVDAWVKASAYPGGARYVVAKGAQGCTAASYAIYTSGGGLAFYVYNPSYTYRLSPVGGTTIWDNQWHHVAGTYDGETVRLYVDGVQAGTGTSATFPIGYGLAPSDDFFIGIYKGLCTLPFKGLIDEVEVLSTALHADDIAAMYQQAFKKYVAIDIKPGSYPNSINLGSAGVIPVAILSSPDFDATLVDGSTVELNDATVKLIGKKGLPSCNAEDVNGDGINDFVCHVYTYEFVIEPGEGSAKLKAKTLGGMWIWGEDSVNIVP